MKNQNTKELIKEISKYVYIRNDERNYIIRKDYNTGEFQLLVFTPVSSSRKSYHLTYTTAMSSHFKEWVWNQKNKTLYVKPLNYGSFIGANHRNFNYLKQMYNDVGINIEIIKQNKDDLKWKKEEDDEFIVYSNEREKVFVSKIEEFGTYVAYGDRLKMATFETFNKAHDYAKKYMK